MNIAFESGVHAIVAFMYLNVSSIMFCSVLFYNAVCVCVFKLRPVGDLGSDSVVPISCFDKYSTHRLIGTNGWTSSCQ